MVRLEEPTGSTGPTVPDTIPGLPPNYNFELPKTIRTILRLSATRVNLQFPDGLLCFAPLLVDFIESSTRARCTILDDVVYGACCVDDSSVECDLLIHYGHSCLIPINEMNTRLLYIFVDIKIDIQHIKNIILFNFTGPISIIGTIQFNKSIHKLKRLLDSEYKSSILIPQIKPLSAGEVLGCTSPVMNTESVIYIGDGRFHLESAMIRNPSCKFYKYCPFTANITREEYDYEKMIKIREKEIKKYKKAKQIGIVLGTLGRQGNTKIMDRLVENIKANGKTVYKIIAEEINSKILDRYEFIDAFVQISCTRLSIDWGAAYTRPLLSPFEVFYEPGMRYEMDYYSESGGQPWQNYQAR